MSIDDDDGGGGGGGDDDDDSLMAVLAQGYRCRKAYIATQGPMMETTEDFWRMLWEHNCSIVVMMTKLKEMGMVSRHQLTCS